MGREKEADGRVCVSGVDPHVADGICMMEPETVLHLPYPLPTLLRSPAGSQDFCCIMVHSWLVVVELVRNTTKSKDVHTLRIL